MKSVIVTSVLVVFLKLLLIPSYRSTDFEVHRNWLAITYDLPLSQWYFDTTSIWTLDYPPFFAYFQRALAEIAVIVDSGMVKINNLEYSSPKTIMFLRCSVICVDIVLMISTWLLISGTSVNKPEEKLSIYCLTIFNAGLILVDHIHFQFNGMLLGLLILCVYFASRRQYLQLTATFSCLVLMKHLFVPLAPIFGLFLISQYCLVDDQSNGPNNNKKIKKNFSMINFLHLVIIAVAALSFAFVPFLLQTNGKDQLPQIFSRLFPFGRGLVHAYWAPNVWALYCAVDKIGYLVLNKLKLIDTWEKVFGVVTVSSDVLSGSNSASGIVGDFIFMLFPRVTAGHCMLLLLLSLLPAMYVIWSKPTIASLLHCLVYSSLSSFMLGYHIHEKAVIIPWLLHTFVCLENTSNKVLFLILSGAGCMGLFPLFTGTPELLIKSTLLVAYLFSSWYTLCEMSSPISKWSRRLVWTCWTILLALFAFTELIHPLTFWRATGTADGAKELFLPFLPLMTTSVVCAAQLMFCWLLSLQVMLQSKL